MSEPSIALVVPLRRQKFLAALTTSVDLAGTFEEIVFAFDGAEDEGLQLRDSLIKWATPHEFVCTGSRHGVSAARNLGTSCIRSDYVVFLDDDDELTDGAVTIARSSLSQRDLPEVLFGNLRLISPSGADEGRDAINRPSELTSPRDYWIALSQGLSQLGATYISVNYLRSIGGFDETLPTWNDRDLQYRLLLGGARVTFTPHDLMRWRRGHLGTLSADARNALVDFKREYRGAMQGWPTLAHDPLFPRYAGRIPAFLAGRGAMFITAGRGGGVALSSPILPQDWRAADQELLTECLFRGLVEVAENSAAS